VESNITPLNHDGIARRKDYNLDLPIIRLFYIHYYSIRRCPCGRGEGRRPGALVAGPGAAPARLHEMSRLNDPYEPGNTGPCSTGHFHPKSR
jgi:hypothetical protein